MTLQDRVLLLFRQRPDWSVAAIARTLVVPTVMVRDAVRAMARKGWFNLRESDGDIAVEITRNGKAALDELVSQGNR